MFFLCWAVDFYIGFLNICFIAPRFFVSFAGGIGINDVGVAQLDRATDSGSVG